MSRRIRFGLSLLAGVFLATAPVCHPFAQQRRRAPDAQAQQPQDAMQRLLQFVGSNGAMAGAMKVCLPAHYDLIFGCVSAVLQNVTKDQANAADVLKAAQSQWEKSVAQGEDAQMSPVASTSCEDAIRQEVAAPLWKLCSRPDSPQGQDSDSARTGPQSAPSPAPETMIRIQ